VKEERHKNDLVINEEVKGNVSKQDSNTIIEETKNKNRMNSLGENQGKVSIDWDLRSCSMIEPKDEDHNRHVDHTEDILP
jgi:hypothetical protein